MRRPGHPVDGGDDGLRDVVQHLHGELGRHALGEGAQELAHVDRLHDLVQLCGREQRHDAAADAVGLPAVPHAFRQVERVDGRAGLGALLDELVHERVVGGLHVVSRLPAARSRADHDRGGEILRFQAELVRRGMRRDEAGVQPQRGRKLRLGLGLHDLAGGVAAHGDVDERVDLRLVVLEHDGDVVGVLAEEDFRQEPGMARLELHANRQSREPDARLARLGLREDERPRGGDREAVGRLDGVQTQDLRRREVAPLRVGRLAQGVEVAPDELRMENVRNDGVRRHGVGAEDGAKIVHELRQAVLQVLRELIETTVKDVPDKAVVVRGVHRDDPVHLRLHGDDAARGERLALAEVVEVHRLPDAPGDVRLAAEHVGDRLPEKVARGIVRVLVRLGPPEGSDLVAAVSHHDGVPGERTGARAAVARDRLFVARLYLLFGELHELAVLCIVKIDSHFDATFPFGICVFRSVYARVGERLQGRASTTACLSRTSCACSSATEAKVRSGRMNAVKATRSVVGGGVDSGVSRCTSRTGSGQARSPIVGATPQLAIP